MQNTEVCVCMCGRENMACMGEQLMTYCTTLITVHYVWQGRLETQMQSEDNDII